MTEAEFYRLVARMREHQRKYFRTRDQFSLAMSKDLEIEVDKAIQERCDAGEIQQTVIIPFKTEEMLRRIMSMAESVIGHQNRFFATGSDIDKMMCIQLGGDLLSIIRSMKHEKRD